MLSSYCKVSNVGDWCNINIRCVLSHSVIGYLLSRPPICLKRFCSQNIFCPTSDCNISLDLHGKQLSKGIYLLNFDCQTAEIKKSVKPSSVYARFWPEVADFALTESMNIFKDSSFVLLRYSDDHSLYENYEGTIRMISDTVFAISLKPVLVFLQYRSALHDSAMFGVTDTGDPLKNHFFTLKYLGRNDTVSMHDGDQRSFPLPGNSERKRIIISCGLNHPLTGTELQFFFDEHSTGEIEFHDADEKIWRTTAVRRGSTLTIKRIEGFMIKDDLILKKQ